MGFWNRKSGPLQFKDDDDAYFAWLTGHPKGFVLNVRREHDPNYVVLHRAQCGSISSTKRASGAYTCKSYRKWCADSEGDLRLADKLEGRKDGTFSKRCGLCNPPTN